MKCPKCQHENPANTSYCGNCGMPLLSPDKIPLAKTLTLETPILELERGGLFAERYEIIEELGKGGMGRVYRVLDTKINEEVALKLIKPEIADSKTIERFGNELKMARKISHKNVCRMYHLSEESGTHYITMEYVPGETLKGMIRMTKQLSMGTAVSTAKQICEGLNEAHRLGVVHRDLKPQNIMIDKQGNARIMDFGIARSLESEGTTRPGIIIGTPEYMSPEQTESREVDQRSDIYSLGIILFEMLTGRIPFEGETPISVAMKQKSEKPPDPAKFNPQIPEDLSHIILTCLEKDREKRYQSAEKLLADLNALEEDLPTTEKEGAFPKRTPVTEREITVRFKPKKALIPVLAVLALAAIALIIWQLFPQREAMLPPSDKPSLVVMYFKNNTGEENLDHWRTALADLLITDLSQSKLIRVVSGEVLYNILERLNQLQATVYSSEVLREVANRGRADRILVGNFTKAGDTFRINTSLQDGRTSELYGSESVEGFGERSFYTMVDELTRRIKAHFELTEEEITADIDSRIETITTSSPEAYKLYSEARTYHLQTDYWRSIGTMQKALEIDPEFAMAWRSVAMAFNNLGRRPAKLEAITKAFELRDKVSERERYTIEADYYKSWEKNYDKAMEAYQKLLGLYPDDTIGNTNLGILYFEMEEFDKAITHYEKKIQNDPDDRLGTWNLIETYEAMGLYDKANQVIKRYLDRNPDNIAFLLKQYNVFLYQGIFDRAQVTLEKYLSLDSNSQLTYDILTGHISLLKGDTEHARNQYQKMQEGSTSRRLDMSNLYLLQGKFKEAETELLKKPVLHQQLAMLYLRTNQSQLALEAFDVVEERAQKAESISGKIMALHAKGLAYVQMKSFEDASRIAEEIRESIPVWMHKKLIKYHDHLLGMIAFERGNFSESIQKLGQAAQSLYAPEDNFPRIQAYFIFTLAQAYEKEGNLFSARGEFEKILFLHLGRIGDGDLYAKSLYSLGKIFEQQGQKEKAVEYFQRFLDLWKNGDPEITEIEDAKIRLNALRSP
ncbi:MAG: protein kinase [Candidatus Aminicenantes bacterium]|nr:MAG: protein kinase [Candidatus Aminicenantes bacterium]